MNVMQLIDHLRNDPSFMAHVTGWHTIPARPAVFGEFPPGLAEELRQALARRGVRQLFSHQARAAEAALEGRDVVVVTPTASGKTLCYNLPVLQTALGDPGARALYLFPTKPFSPTIPDG